jgi:hypothetical protein
MKTPHDLTLIRHFCHVDVIPITVDQIRIEPPIDIPQPDGTVKHYSTRTHWWCTFGYPGNPHGCPNREECAQVEPLTHAQLVSYHRLQLVVATVDFAAYRAAMQIKFPTWSPNQCACVLYWQGSVRLLLKEHILALHPDFVRGNSKRFMGNPSAEASGINMVMTMRHVGITLDFRTHTVYRIIALIGFNQPSLLAWIPK